MYHRTFLFNLPPMPRSIPTNRLNARVKTVCNTHAVPRTGRISLGMRPGVGENGRIEMGENPASRRSPAKTANGMFPGFFPES